MVGRAREDTGGKEGSAQSGSADWGQREDD
jgi:hypothetical protein